jgi:hypothetical protein
MDALEVAKVIARSQDDDDLRSKLAVNPAGTLAGLGIALTDDEARALGQVDWRQPQEQLIAAVVGMTSLWGASPLSPGQHHNLWDARFTATLVSESQRDTFIRHWYPALQTQMYSMNGFRSALVMQSIQQPLVYVFATEWTDYAAAAGLLGPGYQQFWQKNPLGGIATITEPAAAYRFSSEVPGTSPYYDHPVFVSERWEVDRDAEAFVQYAHERQQFMRAAGLGYVAGVVVGGNQGTRYQVLFAFSKASDWNDTRSSTLVAAFDQAHPYATYASQPPVTDALALVLYHAV